MITKFDSLFAGHVDMDNVGYGGVPVNDRRFPNEHLVTVFDKAEAMAQLMDRMGYDTFWMAEHHFQREGYECIPNVLMTALHLAHVTGRLRIGCGFNICPMWHPLRLAEDYATADILSGGRITFGVGRGYHTREVETFGSPLLDQNSNRELFEEQVDIIFKAFNNDSFSHQGKNYTIPARVPYRGYDLEELTLVPRPLRLPVECWQPIQGGSTRALDFMAKHGIRGSSAAARPKAGRCTRSSSIGKQRTPGSAPTSNWASGSASASISTSPTAAKRGSAKPANTTKRT
jgi:alkanesulfonate monooxygenase SsuD/methylene tetrahydromethanopterin reductase-like flavin-dependent oxidoreductase (luciferase family)